MVKLNLKETNDCVKSCKCNGVTPYQQKNNSALALYTVADEKLSAVQDSFYVTH